MINKIEIVVRDVTRKDGKTFKGYSCYKDGVRLANIRFTKDCVPVKTSGVLRVKDGDVFKSNRTQYDTYVIKAYESFTPCTIYIKPKETPFEVEEE